MTEASEGTQPWYAALLPAGHAARERALSAADRVLLDCECDSQVRGEFARARILHPCGRVEPCPDSVAGWLAWAAANGARYDSFEESQPWVILPRECALDCLNRDGRAA